MPLNFFPIKYKALLGIGLFAITPLSYAGLDNIIENEIWGDKPSSIFKRTAAARVAIPTLQLISIPTETSHRSRAKGSGLSR
jgi:hypothetical protein